ncbi:unnamed protein product [Cyprideis torosa]|uniref:Uncharacterized protein n=1 Tax=Cyprideis torosa TaxID=163714 RepID=A0A7R8W257_9CRUS|nr:unnamed protein product [Cyprideis torosa]CAG0881588.1 unnamed protein product [Cyprideis torosa]
MDETVVLNASEQSTVPSGCAALSGLELSRCLIKAVYNQCSAVQSSPDCECCQTIVPNDASFIYAAEGRVCPVGWNYYSHTAKCYLLNTTKTFWQEAENTCVSYGAHLASIHDKEEADFISGLSTDHVWLGGSDVDTETVWVWTDGSPLDYAPWPPDQPGFQTTANWMSMRSSVILDRLATHTFQFMCKKDVTY